MEGFLIPAIGFLMLVVLYASMTVVKPNESIVILRLGRTSADMVRGPGIHFVVPVVDRPVRVPMAEKTTEATVAGTSKDDVAVSADLTLRWRVIEPFKYVVNVANGDAALKDLAGGALEDIDSKEAISFPGRAAAAIEARLKVVAKQWGVTITEVRVRSVSRA